MRTGLFVALILVGISYTQSVNLRIYEEFEFGRNADEDGTATVDNAMNDNEDSEFEIRINSVEDEGKDFVDDSEEDEDGDDDPCLSEPELPECNVDEEEEPPTIL